MPFTLAHPAIILPLNKSKRFSITALIAGSMVPDFEFFFQLREVENIGHHWYGVLFFDVPVALLFCYMFHNLLRNLFIENLPAFLRNRFSPVLGFNWNSFAAENKMMVVYSLLIGIATHILWDGFTHYDGIFVEMVPVLSANTGIQSFNVPVYFLLQVVFSLVGMAAVVWSVYKLPVSIEANKTKQNKIYWPVFILVLSIMLFIRITGWPQYNSFWGVFMAVMGGICYSWLLVSLFIQKLSLKKL